MDFFRSILPWSNHGESYWDLCLFVAGGLIFPFLWAFAHRIFFSKLKGRKFGSLQTVSKAHEEVARFGARTNNRIYGMLIPVALLFCYFLIIVPILPYLSLAVSTSKNGSVIAFCVLILLLFWFAVFYGIKKGLLEWLDPQ